MKNKIFPLLIILLVSVFSCTKNPNKDLSYDNSIHSFEILLKNNPDCGMSSDALISTISGNLYVTVDTGSDLTVLVPTIVSGNNALFFIDDKPVTSGVTEVDLSKTSVLSIQSESGDIKEYYICAKEGNKSIDSRVYYIMKQYSIPGISLSATRDEEMAYSYGYGFANTTTHERVTPNHLFRLASITKSQTSLCLMTLMERGLLKITDRMFGAGGIFESEFGTNILSGTEKITIQNFLEHTSGWSGEHIFTGSSSPLANMDVMGRMNYILHNIPLDNAPGTTYAYYNMGFGILGALVEKLSGKEYETFIREELYAPMGVSDIWVGGDYIHRRTNEVVYYSQDGRDGYANDMDLIKSLGGLIASSEELMKVMAHIDYGTKVPDCLKKETLDLMYTPSDVYPYRYSLGWRTNHSIFTTWENYHGGSLAGTGTFWCRDTGGTAAVVLCNSRSYIDGFDTALYELLDLVLKSI